MLKGWIVYSQVDAKKNQAFISRFFDKEQQYQISFELVYREQVAIGISFDQPKLTIQGEIRNLPNFVIMRTIDPLLSRFFELANLPVFNSSCTASTTNHKFLTHLEVSKLQIPMLPTYYFTGQQMRKTKVFPISYPFVCKKCNGRGGQDVYLLKNPIDIQSLPTLSEKSEWTIQPLAPVAGRDLRVFVVGKEVIGAILRKNENDFRANFSLSQTATWYELCESEIRLVKRIVDHFDFDFVGIDFLFDQAGGLIFNEIEDVVGSRTLSVYSNVDAVDLYLQHILKKLADRLVF